MEKPYRLKKILGPSNNTDPVDVWATKQTLILNGYYVPPEYGMSEFPDQQLFESIKQFQLDNKISVDGIINPGGETEKHLLDQDQVAKTYWCRNCTAPHGGVYSPRVCWQCWDKGFR
jgi:hypothetical protein